ncbi:hypothetical protein DPMN_182790 [Dreissena polymorpha]|uniref:Uncharacterized protein n=1 Tax=Dreissena polymorpha TaxID=45954 RepID=A0A9D4I6H0_DREPO|nr:hypothetical protein DPMN_182790 [Dreissena polymorpha]
MILQYFNAGCEYGDHSTGCTLSSCPNYDAATLASGCCGTCGNTSATSGNSVSPSTCPQTSTSTTSSMTSKNCF